jgi:ATP-dependent protease ClpP protease subunit
VDRQKEDDSMTRFRERARSSIRTIAVTGGLFIAAGANVSAHPFAFDTAKMVGFTVLTAEDGAMDAKDMVVIKYDGPITFPMAENLREIWGEIAKTRRFQIVALRLNSPGGTQSEGEEVISILREIRERAKLVTLVGEHDLCASMCIPLFIQGETRFASPASAWMFHGAAHYMSNVPSLSMTMRYVDYFKDRGVGTTFVNSLVEKQYLLSPGEYWLSGNELAEQSDIVTRIAPSWNPAQPNPGPVPGLRSGI